VKFAARAVLALSLLLGVYVLAAGAVIVLALAVYEGVVHGLGGLLLGKGAALLVVVALALGRAFWGRSTGTRHRARRSTAHR
jgi:hypothetical protein